MELFAFLLTLKDPDPYFSSYHKTVSSVSQPLWEQVAEMLFTPDPEKLLSCSALMKTELFPAHWHVNCITCAEAWDTPECG